MTPGANGDVPDEAALDLQRTLIQELLYACDADDVVSFVAQPGDGLAGWWLGWRDSQGEAEPHAAWDAIRREYPRAAAFPLGPAAERAVKRCVRWIAERERGELTLERVAHAYMTLFLFEATMFALRGSSPRLERDYGFWYHWTPDGSLRTLEEEDALRGRLARASAHHAAELLARWAALRPPGSFCPQRADMSRALGDVFGVMPRAPRRGNWSQPKPLNVLGVRPGAEPLGETVARDAKLVVARGPDANVDLGTDELARACGGSLDGLLEDFLEIAATVYLVDIHVPRNVLLARDLTFLIPVRHPSVWSSNADALARIVAFLTGNAAELRFTGDRAGPKPGRFRVAEDERCVALLSGGLDSFAGATHVLAEGREPTFVSHGANSMLIAMQRSLLDALSEDGRDLEAVSVRTGAAGRSVPALDRLPDQPEQVLYQYARSFLFLTAAACVALARGIATICVYENGPVSLNPSFSEARFNTKTTHPTFLREFAGLVRGVFGVDLHIVNPFELATKGEVVAGLDERWLERLGQTNSCWSPARVRAWAAHEGVSGFEGRHCGRCIPCIWRRAAVHRAGAADRDDAYLIDHLPESRRDSWISREHLTVVADLLRASNLSIALPDDALVDLFPDLDQAGPGSLEDRLDMHRRHAAELVTWFEEAGSGLEYAVPAEA